MNAASLSALFFGVGRAAASSRAAMARLIRLRVSVDCGFLCLTSRLFGKLNIQQAARPFQWWAMSGPLTDVWSFCGPFVTPAANQ